MLLCVTVEGVNTMRVCAAVLYWCLVAVRAGGPEGEGRGELLRKSQWGHGGSSGALGAHHGYSLLSDAVTHAASHDNSGSSGCGDDLACLARSLTDHDRQGLEAIQLLHRQLDDDANGNVDLSESDDFLREELQYDSGYERRQQAFHHNDDMHISARELWEAWLRSEVHNWTVEQTIEWLEKSVELPQYMKTFLEHKVTGATLPRMAVHNMQYLSGVLGIKDPIHKQKIALKAMDVVLFGPPKDGGNRWKDGVMVFLIVSVLLGCWWAYSQARASRKQLARMLKDMDSLKRAEDALENMQEELKKAKMEQENVASEKENLERQLLEAGNSSRCLTTSDSNVEVSLMKAEIEVLRAELHRAERELEDHCWAPPANLQLWLQLTHELENKAYLGKKIKADDQLKVARDACEKLRKKRSSLVGAFVSTHGKSIDDVDRSIVEARKSLNEVTNELQERVYRWKQIESMCGFNIINNCGLPTLETKLYRNSNTRPNRLRMSSSQDDLDMEETSSLYGGATPSIGGGAGGGGDVYGGAWKEDSSGSEEPDPPEGRHYPLDLRLAEARAQRLAREERRSLELKAQYMERMQEYQQHLQQQQEAHELHSRNKDIHFILGGDNVTWAGEEAALPSSSTSSLRSSSRPSSQRPRSTMSVRQVATSSLRGPGGALARSHSTEAGLDSCTTPAPEHNSRLASLSRQKTVAGSEVSGGSSSSEQSLPSDPAVPAPAPAPAAALAAPAAAPPAPATAPPAPATAAARQLSEQLSSSSLTDNPEPRPRRRKMLFPFSKKTKLSS